MIMRLSNNFIFSRDNWTISRNNWTISRDNWIIERESALHRRLFTLESSWRSVYQERTEPAPHTQYFTKRGLLYSVPSLSMQDRGVAHTPPVPCDDSATTGSGQFWRERNRLVSGARLTPDWISSRETPHRVHLSRGNIRNNPTGRGGGVQVVWLKRASLSEVRTTTR